MTARRARTPAAPRHPSMWRRAVLLALAGTIVYANGLSGPFVIDDRTSILENQRIRRLSPLTEVLSPPRDTPVAGRPLVNLTFAVNYAAGGLDPRGYRAINLAIHLLAALALFGVVRRTLGFEGFHPALRAHAPDVAFVCALVWLIHPLQTEVVDYITQRTSGLMGLMYLLTLYCAIRAHDDRGGRWQVAAVTSCAAGMLCKESMVTAPVMVALYDRVFVYSSVREAVRRRGRLYAGLASTWVVLALLLSGRPRTSVGFDTDVNTWTYLLNQATVVFDYLRLAVFPWGLIADYGVPRALGLADVLMPGLLIVGLGLLTVVALARWPRAGFLGAWFFVTLAPTSSLVPIATEVGAERRMYLPLAALAVLAVCAAARALAARRPSRTIVVATCSVVCVMLAAGTVLRNREYRSRLSLAQTIVDRRPHGRAYLRLGALLLDAGERPRALEYLRMARRENALGARFALGTEHLVDGDLDAGIRELREFVRRYPWHRSVPAARRMLAYSYADQGRLDDAARELEAILDVLPDDMRAHDELADVLLRQQRAGEAVAHLELVAARRADARTLARLGFALGVANRYDEAIDVLSRAVAVEPQDARTRQLLGRALAHQGRVVEAVEHFEWGVRLTPDDPMARRDLELARRQAAETARAHVE